MAFKENDSTAQDIESLRDFLGSFLGVIDLAEVTPWDEHLEAVKHAQDTEVPSETDNALTLKEKANKVVHNILDDLLSKDIEVVHAQELLTLLEAVNVCSSWND